MRKFVLYALFPLMAGCNFVASRSPTSTNGAVTAALLHSGPTNATQSASSTNLVSLPPGTRFETYYCWGVANPSDATLPLQFLQSKGYRHPMMLSKLPVPEHRISESCVYVDYGLMSSDDATGETVFFLVRVCNCPNPLEPTRPRPPTTL